MQFGKIFLDKFLRFWEAGFNLVFEKNRRRDQEKDHKNYFLEFA